MPARNATESSEGNMAGIFVHERAREARIGIVVTRADGKVEDHGTVAYWHRNPVKRLVWRIRELIKRTFK